MRLALLLAVLIACSQEPEDALGSKIAAFVTIVTEHRGVDLDRTYARAAEALGNDRRVNVFHRRSVMPDGPRQWITVSVRGDTAPVENALKAKLGAVTGRGFGGEDGWLLPSGGLIVERWKGRIDLTFSPGPPEDALEDLARPRLPSMDSEDARAAVARAKAERRCVAHGNYFVVPEGDKVRVWRRPFAMWNVEIQEKCATAAAPRP